MTQLKSIHEGTKENISGVLYVPNVLSDYFVHRDALQDFLCTFDSATLGLSNALTIIPIRYIDRLISWFKAATNRIIMIFGIKGIYCIKSFKFIQSTTLFPIKIDIATHPFKIISIVLDTLHITLPQKNIFIFNHALVLLVLNLFLYCIQIKQFLINF